MILLATMSAMSAFGHVVSAFTVIDMLSTPRPQPAIVNPRRDLALSVVSKWDADQDSTEQSHYLLHLDASSPPTHLFSSSSGEASEFFWLDDQTLAYLNGSALLTFSTTEASFRPSTLLTFPEGTNPTGLQYDPRSATLVWSGQVWADGGFDKVSELDEAYEKRGDSGVVFDDLLVRHWDTWRTPGKVWTLGMSGLREEKGNGSIVNLLEGTLLVSSAPSN